MENKESIAQIYIGHTDKYDYGKVKYPGVYVVGVFLDGKKIFNGQTTVTKEKLKDNSAKGESEDACIIVSKSGLKDRANDIAGHLRKNKCYRYVIRNGYRVEDGGDRTNNGKLVECDSIPTDDDQFFRKTLDSLLKE